MFQSLTSAEHSAEKIKLGKVAATVGSIIPIDSIAKDVDWRSEEEVVNLLTNRFAASSLPFDARLKLYTELMTVLSIDGLVFQVETEDDLKRLRRGIKMKTIQSLLLPEMDYREGNC